mgnify:FL=1
MIIQEPDTQDVHNRGHGKPWLDCTLCRGLRTFPHKTRSPPLDFSHYMVYEKGMTETQSFRSINSLLWVDSYTYFPSTSASSPLKEVT